MYFINKYSVSIFRLMNFDFLPENFTFLSVLGKGGFAVVISAYDKNLCRKVAIKIIYLNGLKHNYRDKLIKEAYYLKELNHPNIVQYYDVY